MQDWGKIKESISSYCKFAYNESGIAISGSELEEDILIFYNLVNENVPYASLSSLAKEIFPTLQDACVDKIGHLSSLKSLATLLDTFCKRLLVKLGKRTFADVDRKMLRNLLHISDLLPLSVTITIANIESISKSPDGYYILGSAYLTRNQVHNSPAWDSAEVVRRLRYVISSYIFMIHSSKAELLRIDSELKDSVPRYFSQSEENALLYDYISYGNSSVLIKNRIIDTYIQHQLYKCGDLTEEELIDKVYEFSDCSLSISAAKRKLERLAKNDLILLKTHVPKTYGLSSEEYKRIKEAEEDYNMAMNQFNIDIHDILTNYGLNNYFDKIIDLVNKLLEAQYNYDIDEALLQSENEGKGSNSCYIDFLNELQLLGCNQDKAVTLYKSILKICKDNDVLVRINAGKAFVTVYFSA